MKVTSGGFGDEERTSMVRVQSVRRGEGGCVGGASCNSSLCVRHPMHHLLCHQAPALFFNGVRRISTLGPGSR